MCGIYEVFVVGESFCSGFYLFNIYLVFIRFHVMLTITTKYSAFFEKGFLTVPLNLSSRHQG